MDNLLEKINEKYSSKGHDPNVFLQGLLHSKPINYWDYCEVDTLLTLQKPRTNFPDEMIFIMYHQVNELLFKMILWELEQISAKEALEVSFFKERLGRVARYFDVLTESYNIMTEGMEVEQYMQFRTTLAPASGFQSAQYRMIEIYMTDMKNLLLPRFRGEYNEEWSWEEKFSKVYWQAAGYNHKTGKKTMTLEMFEEKYLDRFIQLAKQYENSNLLKCYQNLSEEQKQDKEVINALRHLDYTINIKWVMAHYNTAEKYLESGKKRAKATGGSDWKKYMHPSFQKRIFFPELWSAEEIENWGK